MIQQTDADLGLSSKTYHISGQIATLEDQNGQTTAFSYDSYDRLSGIYAVTGAGITFQYNALDQVESQSNGRNQTTTYEYDVLGRLSQAS